MSYGYTPYRVPVGRIEALLADPDSGEVERLLGALAEPIRDHDEYFDDAIASGHPGLADAIRQLIAGRMRGDCGYVYAYAFEQLCDHYGEALDNTYTGPVEEFDDALRALGVRGPVTMDFQGFEPPIPLPDPEDFPSCVALSAKQCAEAADAYRAVLARLDEDWQVLAEEWITWFTAGADVDHTLVVFYY